MAIMISRFTKAFIFIVLGLVRPSSIHCSHHTLTYTLMSPIRSSSSRPLQSFTHHLMHILTRPPATSLVTAASSNHSLAFRILFRAPMRNRNGIGPISETHLHTLNQS